ncbi:uncharacterized protein LOC6553087 [Drosophila erecta]|uniref:uncharacterized protein LOC6553087 n=1 Tax=Drosophila erecta TaxID=7220 RepID=UPI0007329D44|nr:uncharacterized protein LOC6553087 [Drosophila erecta]EDV49064.2 uncharacterized protein Dere_GG20355 [Drosophila erecta]
MDRSKKFMQNVADLACQMNLNQLERSTMAYKCLCLELESMSNAVIPAVTPPTSPPPAAGVPSKGLRASASEFVPQVPLTSDRISIELDNEQDEDSDNDGYDEERNRAPKPAIYGLRFYSHHYDVDVSDNHLEAEKKRKYGYRAPKFRPNQPPGQSVKSETSSTAIAKPPPELVNGQPHFKGPYMPLLQHRISNAEAYGLIQGSDERNSLLLEDMVKQLARLDNCPFNLSSLFPDKGEQKLAP